MIRKIIQEGLTIAKYLSTDLMTADTLTKGLSGPSFVCNQIGLLNYSSPSPPPSSSSSSSSSSLSNVEDTDTAFYSVDYFL